MADKYIKPAGQGGDYTTLAAWEAQNRDLVTATDIENAIIDGDWTGVADSTAVTIAGWTTSAAYYINIYTTAAARHGGKWDANEYNLSANDTSTITISVGNVFITGLQVASGGTYNTRYIFNVNADVSNINISKCVCKMTGTGGTGSAWLLANSPTTQYAIKAWNNIIYDLLSVGFYGEGAQPTLVSYNNTFSRCAGGGIGGYNNRVLCKNTRFYLVGTNATFYAGSGNNVDSDTNSFVDDTNRDYHLAVGDTVSIDQGADLSGDGILSFSDDIDGVTRPGTWDIGADEYVAAVGSILPLVAFGTLGGNCNPMMG